MKNKRIIKILIIIILSLGLTGCWNYVGINEMTIVTGFAIDKTENNQLHVTCEIVDLIQAGNKEKTISTKLIESDGKTVFDAVRNAKRRVNNKLYFGNAQIIIISNQIASSDGISELLDWFIRDAEPRETVSVVISQEKTAKDILSQKGVGSSITSLELKEIVEKDKRITLSTKDTELYKIYGLLKAKGKSLTLSAFHQVQNDDKLVNEVNGTAVFKKDKLIGYLGPDETKYFLFTINGVEGGKLNLNTTVNNNKTMITFEIFRSNTSVSYKYINNKVEIIIKPNIKVSIDVDENHKKPYDEKAINKITTDLEQLLIKNIKSIVKTVQEKYNSDIFGFGNMIYKSNPKLWEKLDKNWDKMFKEIKVQVEPKIIIINTAYIQ